MLNRRSEQRRRDLFGIHPPACTCVNCDRKRRGLPPLPARPPDPSQIREPERAGAERQNNPGEPPLPTPPLDQGKDSDYRDRIAAVRRRVEEVQRQQAQAAAQEAAQRIREQDTPGIQGAHEQEETPTSRPSIVALTTDGPHDDRTRLLAPMLLTVLALAVAVSVGALTYWMLSSPADASSQVSAPTPDIESTIQAAVALAVTREAQSRNSVDPATPHPIVAVTESPNSANASVVLQEAEGDSAEDIPTTAIVRLRRFECSYCNSTDGTDGHLVSWEWEPRVTASGWLSVHALINQQADFSSDNPPRCTPANVSLSDDRRGFYGWVIPRSKASRCGARSEDWVSNSYEYDDGRLSFGVQLDEAAATHPRLEVCLWTGGATKSETRLIDCRRVQQP